MTARGNAPGCYLLALRAEKLEAFQDILCTAQTPISPYAFTAKGEEWRVMMETLCAWKAHAHELMLE